MYPGTSGPQGWSALSTTRGIGWSGGGCEQLIETGVGIRSLDVGINLEGIRQVAVENFLLPNPLFGRLRLSQELGEGVDEHHPVYVVGIGHRVEPDDQPTIGVADDHEWHIDFRRADQRMEIGDGGACGRRHRHRVTPAGTSVGKQHSRAVIGADAGECWRRRQRPQSLWSIRRQRPCRLVR